MSSGASMRTRSSELISLSVLRLNRSSGYDGRNGLRIRDRWAKYERSMNQGHSCYSHTVDNPYLMMICYNSNINNMHPDYSY